MEIIELFAINKKTSLNQVFHEKTNYLLMKTGTNKQSTSCYQATNWQDILGVENNSLSVPWYSCQWVPSVFCCLLIRTNWCEECSVQPPENIFLSNCTVSKHSAGCGQLLMFESLYPSIYISKTVDHCWGPLRLSQWRALLLLLSGGCNVDGDHTVVSRISTVFTTGRGRKGAL